MQPSSHKKNLWFSLALLAVICCCLWLVHSSVNPPLPNPGERPRLYSNQCQQDLRTLFVKAIQSAKESIHLVMFGLSDPVLLQTLKQQIASGIDTTVYYDPKGSPQLRSSLKGSHLHCVLDQGLMHRKVLILDQQRVFIGSANMTSSSLRMHDNLVIGLSQPQVAQFLQEHSPKTGGRLHAMVGGQMIDLWLLPDPRGHALADLKRHLRNASQSLNIALFTFTHPSLIDEVIAAKERGVKTTVVVDLHNSLGASFKTVQRLKEAGVDVLLSQGLQLLHHKFVWIDERLLISGSANWTKAAFYKNSDCILVLYELSDEQRRFMKRLWHRIVHEAKQS